MWFLQGPMRRHRRETLLSEGPYLVHAVDVAWASRTISKITTKPTTARRINSSHQLEVRVFFCEGVDRRTAPVRCIQESRQNRHSHAFGSRRLVRVLNSCQTLASDIVSTNVERYRRSSGAPRQKLDRAGRSWQRHERQSLKLALAERLLHPDANCSGSDVGGKLDTVWHQRGDTPRCALSLERASDVYECLRATVHVHSQHCTATHRVSVSTSLDLAPLFPCLSVCAPEHEKHVFGFSSRRHLWFVKKRDREG